MFVSIKEGSLFSNRIDESEGKFPKNGRKILHLINLFIVIVIQKKCLRIKCDIIKWLTAAATINVEEDEVEGLQIV